jgi:hypothetical protein
VLRCWLVAGTRTSGTMFVMADTIATENLAGPWEAGFSVTVPFALQSKSNFRRHSRSAAEIDRWRRHQDFETTLQVILRRSCPQTWEVGNADDSLSKRPQVVAFLAAATLLDSGNLPKSVLDAAEGVLFHNDASVRSVTATTTHRRRVNQLGWLGFVQLSASATPAEVADATAALTQLWVSAGCPPH